MRHNQGSVQLHVFPNINILYMVMVLAVTNSAAA